MQSVTLDYMGATSPGYVDSHLLAIVQTIWNYILLHTVVYL